MNEREREIDKRIRKAQRAEIIRVLGESKLGLIVGLALLATIVLGASFSLTPTKREGAVFGHVVNQAALATGRNGKEFRREVVRLDQGGAIIEIDLPKADEVSPGAVLKIDVYQKDWGPLHYTSYRFAGFAGESGKG